MKEIHVRMLLLGLLVSPWQIASGNEPVPVTKIFESTQAVFANPERGWITHRFSDDLWGLSNLRNSAEKVSLVLIKIDISAYVNSAHIGQSKLNEIRTALNNCRQQGVKTLLRSAYAWDEMLAPDPKNIETIKTHVMDMKPIYIEYEDIIVAVEMGMFGPWGEMHSSSHSTVNTKLYYPVATGALKQVHATYMLALPSKRSVLVRRPYYIRQLFNDDKPLTSAEAYGNTPKARTGYHNDAYLASIDDGGTFGAGWSRAQELTYINKMTQYAFFGGESFGTPNDAYNNAKNALVESKQQHMTYLHRDYQKSIYDAWGSSGKEDFTRKLGYRFELKNLSYTREVAPGGILHFSLKLQNTGFSAMHLNRPVNLILENGKVGSERIKYQTTLTVDPRTWTPEIQSISIDRKFRIPAMAKEGIWQLRITLPDASVSLQTDGRYAVRFANANMWNDDGTNLLANDISIKASASGSRTTDNVFQEITATTEVSSPIRQLGAIKVATSVVLFATFDQEYTVHQALLDADNNPATGYFVQGIGADYLVQNNQYYQHKGIRGSDWLWQPFSVTVTPSINSQQYAWYVPVSNLNPAITQTSQVIFAGVRDGKTNYSAAISVAMASN